MTKGFDGPKGRGVGSAPDWRPKGGCGFLFDVRGFLGKKHGEHEEPSLRVLHLGDISG